MSGSVTRSESKSEPESASRSKSGSRSKQRTLEETIRVGNFAVQCLVEAINDKIKEKEPINLVGYVYDAHCTQHKLLPVTDERGRTVPHQESPDRVAKINGAIRVTGLNQIMFHAGTISLKRADFLRAHVKEYTQTIEDVCKQNRPAELPPPSTETSITDFNSLESIFAAVASVMGGVNVACSGAKISTAQIIDSYKQKQMIPPRYKSEIPKRIFCNVRPPGHHAHSDHGAGFCFMNNVVIGAKYALDKYPNINRVFIFDWDLHHGDGTQQIVGQEPTILADDVESPILYGSIHRGKETDDDGNQKNETDFYPFTGTTKDNETFTNVINVPLEQGATIDDYKAGFNRILRRAKKFNPDLIMISAGFDSHKDDLYGELPLDYGDYEYMTKKLINLANECADGRIVSVLEGGYTIDVLIRCVAVHVATMINY